MFEKKNNFWSFKKNYLCVLVKLGNPFKMVIFLGGDSFHSDFNYSVILLSANLFYAHRHAGRLYSNRYKWYIYCFNIH